MVQAAQKPQTLLSSRIPRDTEHERYHPELEEELKAVSYTHLTLPTTSRV